MCQTDECLNDSGDCDMDTMCVDDYCAKFYGFASFAMDDFANTFLANFTVACYDWIPKLEEFYDVDHVIKLTQHWDVFGDPEKCIEFVRYVVDFNGDGYINFREATAITALGVSNFSLAKAIGVNCSACVGMDVYNIDYGDL